MIMVNPYWYTPSVAFIGILDTHSGSVGAYSLRLLKASFSGNFSVRLLRVGSSVEVDVHFDYSPIIPVVSLNSVVSPAVGSTNALTLGEFIAAPGYINKDGLSTPASASVSIVYDQISNRNLSQSTPTAQPLIAQSGSLITTNSHISMLFDGVNDMLRYQGSFYSCTDISTFSVYQMTGASSTTVFSFIESASLTVQRRQSANQTPTQVVVQKVYTGFTSPIGNGAFTSVEACTVNRFAYDAPTTRTFIYSNPTSTSASVNSGLVYQGNTVIPELFPTELLIGALRTNNPTTATSFFIGYFSEFIVFNGTDSFNMFASPATKRNPITANILSYY